MVLQMMLVLGLEVTIWFLALEHQSLVDCLLVPPEAILGPKLLAAALLRAGQLGVAMLRSCMIAQLTLVGSPVITVLHTTLELLVQVDGPLVTPESEMRAELLGTAWLLAL